MELSLSSSGEIVERLAASISSELSAEIQEELAKLAVVLTDLSSQKNPALLHLAQVAVAALTNKPPNLGLAKDIRRALERKAPINFKSLLMALRRSSTAQVVFGLSALLYVALPIGYLITLDFGVRLTFLGVNADILSLVVIAGAIGSIVSIMVRIDNFARIKNAEAIVLFLTGFFKPVIGMSFALFIFAAISSGLLPLSIPKDQANLFFAALSFIAGFSERFARDVVSMAEGKVPNTEANPAQ